MPWPSAGLAGTVLAALTLGHAGLQLAVCFCGGGVLVGAHGLSVLQFACLSVDSKGDMGSVK